MLDQLVYVRAEFADVEAGRDDTTRPETQIEGEIARRGLDIPIGSDLATPGRADQDPPDEHRR